MLPVLVFCMLGVPLPDFAPKFVDERFPCEKCACGCRSAAHCWDKCCCFTDQEKLDWAKKNQVQPPQFLVARVAESKKTKPTLSQDLEVASNSNSSTQSARCGCCEKRKGLSSVADNIKKLKECVTAKNASVGSKCKTCCSETAPSCQRSGSSSCGTCAGVSCTEANCDSTNCSTSSCDDESKLEKRTKVILLESALKCQGIQMALLLFKSTLTSTSGELQFTTPPAIGKFDIFDLVATTIYLELDGPVPRSV